MTATTTARDVALEVLTRIEERDAFLQPALEAAAQRAGLDARDRALALELASGVVRWQRRLDYDLARHVTRGLGNTQAVLRRILRIGVYQLRLLERIPARAAVHAAVEQARAAAGEQAARFVNGALRAVARTPESLPEARDPRSLAIRASHPDWLVERWWAELGPDEAAALCAANDAPAPLVARSVGPRDALVERLQAEGAEAHAGRFAPDAVVIGHHPAPFAGESFKAGAWFAQDEAAQLVTLLVDARPGDAVWDVCAAPGGKSMYLAQQLQGQGTLRVTDVHPGKVERLRALLVANGARPGVEVARHDAVSDPVPPAAYDRVLLDAPCSGLGTLRRHPEMKWRRTPRDVADLARTQALMLRQVASSVKPGGLLVFSVCTVTREEGPDQVDAFLKDHPEFKLEAPSGGGVDWAPLLQGWTVRTWPHRHGTDGFFGARLRRREGV